MRPHIHISVDRLRRRADRRPLAARGSEERTCKRCGTHFRDAELVRSVRVCSSCGHHFPIPPRDRLDALADGGRWTELWPGLRAADPFQFVDLEPYPDRVRRAEAVVGTGEAIVAAELGIGGLECLAGVMDFGYLGGSMGAVVGEKLVRLADRAVLTGRPVVLVTASGGARMQESVLALMQMAKTIVALETLQQAAIPVVVILAHPTTGGVWASFASLGDFTYAEPGALIAFSGPRVIEQTTREKLPSDFGLAESQLAHGHVDAVVPRPEIPERLARVLGILDVPRGYAPAPAVQWAQERAARAAQVLPDLSRRLINRVRRPEGAAQ